MPQPLLNGALYPAGPTVLELQEQVRQLRDELSRERNRETQVESGVRELRRVLDPLYRALQMVYGEIGELGIQPGLDLHPAKAAAWENWKKKLGGLPARFIDVLMIHGEMTQTQLRIAVGCAAGSVAGVVCTLNKAGLINKAGGKVSLKEL